MNDNSNAVNVEFVADEQSAWRAADLMPREGCVIGNDVYIKLGVGEKNEVELHVQDDHRMARGAEGASLKKCFFFHVQTASIVALPGNTKVTPRRMNFQVFEVVTFTAHSTVPFDRETQLLEIKHENWGQEVTDAD